MVHTAISAFVDHDPVASLIEPFLLGDQLGDIQEVAEDLYVPRLCLWMIIRSGRRPKNKTVSNHSKPTEFRILTI